MKYLPIYNELFDCKNEDDVFIYFLQNLKPSNTLWSYFVNWEKVFGNVRNIEICLNLLNYLIGKENFDEEFTRLLSEQPQIIRILPSLVVCRDKKFKILVDFENKQLKYEDYDFKIKNPTDTDIEKYLYFVKESGLKDLIVSNKIKSLVDYVIGVEAGLDSNGRKNRSGHSMEDIVEVFIKDACVKKGYLYLKEANALKIKQEFGENVPVDKSSKRYDFVIKTDSEIVLFEVNFYNDGGSKPSETAKAYRTVQNSLKDKYKFVWVTDGFGWKSAHHSLRDTFDYNDYVISLAMLEKGILERII